MRIGVIGGTFDPIHNAHLLIAEEARMRLSLEEVVFIPTGQPWLKADKPVSPGEQRLEMVRLAISSNPFFRASSVEVDRSGPTYSVDTLEALQQEWGSWAEIYFILGMDALLTLPQWKEPARLLELCTLVVFTRPDQPSSALDGLVNQLPGLKEKMQLVEGPQIGVSGTEIRRRIEAGTSTRHLVPLVVGQFIVQHGLYTKDGSG
jgi:nicotinate-nucleotide adenylyltransferase